MTQPAADAANKKAVEACRALIAADEEKIAAEQKAAETRPVEEKFDLLTPVLNTAQFRLAAGQGYRWAFNYKNGLGLHSSEDVTYRGGFQQLNIGGVFPLSDDEHRILAGGVVRYSVLEPDSETVQTVKIVSPYFELGYEYYLKQNIFSLQLKAAGGFLYSQSDDVDASYYYPPEGDPKARVTPIDGGGFGYALTGGFSLYEGSFDLFAGYQHDAIQQGSMKGPFVGFTVDIIQAVTRDNVKEEGPKTVKRVAQ